MPNAMIAPAKARTCEYFRSSKSARRFDSMLLTNAFYHSGLIRSRYVAKTPVGIDLFVRRCMKACN
jgi:hypothetical protein